MTGLGTQRMGPDPRVQIPRSIDFAGFLFAVTFYLALAVGGLGLGDEFDPTRAVLIAIVTISAVISLKNLSPKATHVTIIIAILLYCLLILLRSHEINSALEKLDGLIVGGLFIYIIGRSQYSKNSEFFLRNLIAAGLFILTITIAYKIQFGFFDRQVRYFLNGPIVFGWLMAVMAIISLYVADRDKDKRFYIAAAIFLAAALWSASKGPLAGFMAALPFIFVHRQRFRRMVMLIAVLIVGLVLAVELNLIPERLSPANYFSTGDPSSLSLGSIGIRQIMWTDAWSIFKSQPILGVGLGNWSSNTSIFLAQYEFKYPHNILAEVLSEQGIIGALFWSSILTHIFLKSHGLSRAIFVFSGCALMFSGDMAYWRLLIFIPLILIDRRH